MIDHNYKRCEKCGCLIMPPGANYLSSTTVPAHCTCRPKRSIYDITNAISTKEYRQRKIKSITHHNKGSEGVIEYE